LDRFPPDDEPIVILLIVIFLHWSLVYRLLILFKSVFIIIFKLFFVSGVLSWYTRTASSISFGGRAQVHRTPIQSRHFLRGGLIILIGTFVLFCGLMGVESLLLRSLH
jgi:hypothetical protein